MSWTLDDVDNAAMAVAGRRRWSENVCTHCEIESVLEVPDKRLNDAGCGGRGRREIEEKDDEDDAFGT